MTDDRSALVGGITVPYRVRFDECGPDGLARAGSLLRYAQDVAWVHSEALGFSREWYDAEGLAWVVRAAELAVLAPIRSGVTLHVSTAIVGFRRVWARRRTEARFEDGSMAFWGHTDFVMLDVARGMPGRVPDAFTALFAVPPGSFEPGRVVLPATPEAATVVTSAVRPRDIDPMGHVNNTVYVDYLEEAVLAAGAGPTGAAGGTGGAGGTAAAALAAIPRTLRLEYVVAAGPGELLVSAAWQPDDATGGWAWRLVDGEGRELARGHLNG